jgi:hypothetical protein
MPPPLHHITFSPRVIKRRRNRYSPPPRISFMMGSDKAHAFLLFFSQTLPTFSPFLLAFLSQLDIHSYLLYSVAAAELCIQKSVRYENKKTSILFRT